MQMAWRVCAADLPCSPQGFVRLMAVMAGVRAFPLRSTPIAPPSLIVFLFTERRANCKTCHRAEKRR